MKFIILSVLLYSAFLNAATIEVQGNKFLSDTVEDVLKSLPSDYLMTINNKIFIIETPFRSDLLFKTENLCQIDEGVQFGFTRKNTITISSHLVNLAQKNSQEFKCGHKSFAKLLKAVVIHELTHVKDNQEKISTEPDF